MFPQGGAYTRARKSEESLSQPIPVGGGAVDTYDWCIICIDRTATRCHFKFHYDYPFYLIKIFTFSIQIMFYFSLISSDANDPQGLMHL